MTNPENGKSKWMVLAVIAVGVFMAMVDSSIVNLALPTIVRTLNTDFTGVQWIPLAYMLTVTCLIMAVGRMGDIFGKRVLYGAGMAIFTVGSLCCGMAPTVGLLIAARVFQGVGAAIIMALGPAVLIGVFPPAERGRALGFTGTAVSAGIVVGPPIGGLILAKAAWGWIFFVNLPFGVLGTVLALKLIPSDRRAHPEKFDIAGAVLLAAGLFGILFGLSVAQKGNTPSAVTIGAFVLAILALVTFVLRELRLQHPLIDLRMFRNGMFTQNLLASFLSFITTAGTMILMPFYLQVMLRLDTSTAGLVLATMPIVMGVVAPMAGWLADRFGTQVIAMVGLLILGVGFFLVQSLDVNTTVVECGLRFAIIGLGLALFQSPNNSAILGAAPREKAGVASGLLAVARTLGQTAGIAVTGAFWVARVAQHAGGLPEGGASRASAAAQLSGLHDTYWVILVLTGLSFAIIGRVVLGGRRQVLAVDEPAKSQ